MRPTHLGLVSRTTRAGGTVDKPLKVEVTLANNVKKEIEFTSNTQDYEADMATLREIYGDRNVEEID